MVRVMVVVTSLLLFAPSHSVADDILAKLDAYKNCAAINLVNFNSGTLFHDDVTQARRALVNYCGHLRDEYLESFSVNDRKVVSARLLDFELETMKTLVQKGD